MKELEYPFDPGFLLKKSKRLKRELLADGTERLKKRIAVLGGSTTHDILRMLELFLLYAGIEPEFYESEYAQYWQDAMFPPEELKRFHPDLVIICTSTVNLEKLPDPADSAQMIEDSLQAELTRFSDMWDSIKEHFSCTVIQNNFEYPSTRLLGNRDCSDPHGAVRYVNRMNVAFAEAAEKRQELQICDICYLSARLGLDNWSDPFCWHMYKYALSFNAIPELAFQYANMIKAIYGKNKKALVLDLDNTLWGGVVGDDGPEGIEIGQETSEGQAYQSFQRYLKKLRSLGIMLTVDSKNDPENALAGLRHPDGVLRPEDMVCIRANWEPKSENFGDIAKELNILPESMVFVDDNPAEREIVSGTWPGAAVPELGRPELYERVLDHAGYFENISLSADDMKRSDMMRENVLRNEAKQKFADYGDYLRSLEMRADIGPFDPLYYPRIAQLTNKSNQFNVTTRRYTESDIRGAAEDETRITVCGRLEDRFGDNGIVSLAVGRIQGEELHIELFLMSCRVLKRDMEFAMMDAIVSECIKRGIKKVFGYYLPTAKNHMVEGLFEQFGFMERSRDDDGKTVWELDLTDGYEKRNRYIAIRDAFDA